MRTYANVIEAIGRTPLIKLRRASELSGANIYGKAEFLNPGQSVKDRAALGMIRDAEKSGRLKPGGLVYNSYNCLPGWAADAPLQKLVFEAARQMSGDVTQRTQAALKSVEELVGAKFSFFSGNPAAAGNKAAGT